MSSLSSPTTAAKAASLNIFFSRPRPANKAGSLRVWKNRERYDDPKRIENAIRALPEEQYHELRRWFLERECEKWDAHIDADSASGALDFLLKGALDEKAKGKLQDL